MIAPAFLTTTSRAPVPSRWPALIAAMRITGGRLSEQKMLFLGAGEAGIGIADVFVAALRRRRTSPEDARANMLVRRQQRPPGLRVARQSRRTQRPYAHDCPGSLPTSSTAVTRLKPTPFSDSPASRTPSPRKSSRPWPSSTIDRSFSHCPIQLRKPSARPNRRTTGANGRAIFASGSPFDPVTIGNQDLRPRAGQQCLHLPGRRAGRHCQRHAQGDRRDVPGRGASPSPTRSLTPISNVAASIRRCRESARCRR